MQYFLLQAKGFLFFFATVGIFSHLVGESLPRRHFHYDAWPYKSFSWEKEGGFYSKTLDIRKWRKYLPDKSKAVKSMYRKSLGVNFSEAHVERLIQETCVAEFVHLLLIFASPLLLVFMEGRGAIICAIGFACGNVPFILIQRYNRPKLVKLYLGILRRKNKTLSEDKNNVYQNN
jgi:glycosyl-4,4'-diaponeurosporenoate acyltransferase